MYFFSVVFTHSLHSHHGSVISLLLPNPVYRSAALPNHMMGEGIRGTQKEDDRRPLSFQSSLPRTLEVKVVPYPSPTHPPSPPPFPVLLPFHLSGEVSPVDTLWKDSSPSD
jgi:hypothetical protein